MNPERSEETINCSVKVKFSNLESLLSSLCLIGNRSPTLGNFRHWWASNLNKSFRSESRASLHMSLLEPTDLLPKRAEWMSVTVNILSGLLWFPVPWLSGTLLTLSMTPSWGLLQDLVSCPHCPSHVIIFIPSSIFLLQIHVLHEAEARVLTGRALSKHADVIPSLDSEQRRSLWESLSARVDPQERAPRFPSKNSFKPRLMPLRRAVYRAAVLNLTLIKHFKCSYRNRVTNPNSTLLTDCRLSLQSPV